METPAEIAGLSLQGRVIYLEATDASKYGSFKRRINAVGLVAGFTGCLMEMETFFIDIRLD